MSTNTNDSEKSAATEVPAPKPKRAAAKKAKAPKKTAPAKKPGKRKAESANKKAEVITLMKRAKGATLAEKELILSPYKKENKAASNQPELDARACAPNSGQLAARRSKHFLAFVIHLK